VVVFEFQIDRFRLAKALDCQPDRIEVAPGQFKEPDIAGGVRDFHPIEILLDARDADPGNLSLDRRRVSNAAATSLRTSSDAPTQEAPRTAPIACRLE
jgi:hypothetical protein